MMDSIKPNTSNVRSQAEAMISELNPILRSSDPESFCKILLPQLLKSHVAESQKTLELWQRGQQSNREDNANYILSLDGTREWADVASLIDEAFEQCTTELSSADNEDDVRRADNRWPINGDSGLDLDPSISLRDDSSPLRLCVCKRCSRVVLQRRFLAHWTECKSTDYSQPRLPAAAAAAARDVKSPVNPGSAASAGGLKSKPPKGAVKHGTGPAKFVGSSRGNGALSDRDRKRRKVEEGLDFVEEYRWVAFAASLRGSGESHYLPVCLSVLFPLLLVCPFRIVCPSVRFEPSCGSVAIRTMDSLVSHSSRAQPCSLVISFVAYIALTAEICPPFPHLLHQALISFLRSTPPSTLPSCPISFSLLLFARPHFAMVFGVACRIPFLPIKSLLAVLSFPLCLLPAPFFFALAS
jgi:hypothetical protein